LHFKRRQLHPFSFIGDGRGQCLKSLSLSERIDLIDELYFLLLDLWLYLFNILSTLKDKPSIIVEDLVLVHHVIKDIGLEQWSPSDAKIGITLVFEDRRVAISPDHRWQAPLEVHFDPITALELRSGDLPQMLILALRDGVDLYLLLAADGGNCHKVVDLGLRIKIRGESGGN
jgi:hypothetical protein